MLSLAYGPLSGICSLRCRVPQASIFGVLLFIYLFIFFHINDLPNPLSSRQPRMSAADTHITCVGELFTVNPFTAKGLPIDEYNRLALDR